MLEGHIRVDIRIDPIRVDDDLDPLDRKSVTFQGHLILSFRRGRVECEIDRGMGIKVEWTRNRVENGQNVLLVALSIVEQARFEYLNLNISIRFQ